ncbi:HAD family hydrolase [Occultella glacieicola]|uniref:HAD family hydrolase n=2 Tax=Occultella glacieicola TaxID=2518684 RepID=A0ABY2DZM7_9MICO|nr:HAD family hydrolase [Occultella glacieicola]
MDGTLVDTEPLWHRSQRRLAGEGGIAWTDADCALYTGRPMTEWAGAMRRRGHPNPAEVIIADAVAMVAAVVREDVPWLPGALDLLSSLAAADIPCALVTNAGRANADALLEAAPPGSLAFATAAEDVTRGKPDPEPYLLAASRLGIDPSISIAFEDSASGARSAHAAGLSVWFIDSHTPDPGVPVAGRIGSLAEFDAARLGSTRRG